MIHLLTGDIGGTKTRLSLYEIERDGFMPMREAQYVSQDYASLEGIVESFMPIDTTNRLFACFGVAGPVRDGKCKTTNLAWHVDAAAMKAKLGFEHVSLINDLEATAWGIPLLDEDDVLTLHKGKPQPQGNCSVIAAGTGLGEAGMYWDGKLHRPFASEGSHADFSPTSEFDMDFYRFLAGRYDHVSWERVVSGPGLKDLFDFVCQRRKQEVPNWIEREVIDGTAPAAISKAALEGSDEACVEALDHFVRLYGAEAGNHALKLMATGGVYVGGGITPKIAEKLKDGAFLEAFFAKGRMRVLLEAMPVKLIMNDRAALYGPLAYMWHSGMLGEHRTAKLTIKDA